jgi:hypothetical protein
MYCIISSFWQTVEFWILQKNQSEIMKIGLCPYLIGAAGRRLSSQYAGK